MYDYAEPHSSSLRAASMTGSLASTAANGVPSGLHSVPRITTEGQVFRVQLGETLLLPCAVKNLGPMVLLWKKGTRVLTAGNMKVRRDDRIELVGTGLQIQ